MASKAAATAAKALYAEQVFVPKGPINGGRFNLLREIGIGTGLGLIAGMTWKVRMESRAREPERGGSAAERGDATERDGENEAPLAARSRAPPSENAQHSPPTHATNNNQRQQQQMYHWGEKRRVATFYKELAEKEATRRF